MAARDRGLRHEAPVTLRYFGTRTFTIRLALRSITNRSPVRVSNAMLVAFWSGAASTSDVPRVPSTRMSRPGPLVRKAWEYSST